MMARGYMLLIVLLLLGTALAGCSRSAPLAGATPTIAPTATLSPEEQAALGCTALQGALPVGAAISLSGPAASYGQSILQGLEMAVQEVNEQKVIGPDITLDLLTLDDGSNPDQAADVFRELVQEREVVAIIGPTLSSSAVVADPIALSVNVPVIATSNTAENLTELGRYLFRVSLPESRVIPNTVRAARQQRSLQRAFIVYGEDDVFTESGYRIMQEAALNEEMEIVGEAPFVAPITDFEAIIEQIAEADPDVILVSALLNEGSLFLIQLRNAGLDMPVIGGNGFNSPRLLEIAGPAANGLLVGAAWSDDNISPTNSRFILDYRALYGSSPDQFAAQSYTGLWLLAQALRESCSQDRAVLRDSLANLRLVPTPLGSFSFTLEREPLHPPVVLLVRNGSYTLFTVGN